MIGTVFFVLMGQIAELAGDLLPIAFIAGAIFVAFSSYSYVQFSNAYKSSGGVANFLTKDYELGTAPGSFSLLMYVSMVVAESLVAGTFGAYALRLFPEEHAGYASVLGIILIAVAYIVDIYGNKVIEATATLTVIIKVAGIALFAISGLVISSLPTITGTYIATNSQYLPESFNFIAA
jgi:amino acid transporter